MKNGSVRYFLMAVVMIVIGISINAALAKEEIIELKYAGLLPPGTTMSLPVDEWGKRVSERTNGKVKLTTYHAQTLGKWLEYPKLAKSGLCDMFFAGGTTPGFELLGVGELPILFNSQRLNMDVMNELYCKGLLSSIFEGNGFKLMFFMNNDPDKLFLCKKKLISFRDIKGMKIRANTPVDVQNVKATGATVVQISAADLYMALQRGTVDGIVSPAQGVLAQRYYEALKYVVWEPISVDTIAIAMNLKVWNSLPAEVRLAILEVNQEIRYWHLDQFKGDDAYQEIFREKGIEILKIDQEERGYLHSKFQPIYEPWIEKMEAKGVPARKAFDEVKRVVAEY
jgi:TRAP-type C4-dicarboxylate transport system substrate-binding protein